MALSTTQSIWRSGGGDQTRTAYCGSGIMAAQFYIPEYAEDSSPVVVSSATGAPNLILPAGAIITAINVTTADISGTIDLIATGPSGTVTLANNLSVAAVGTTSIGSVISGTPTTEITTVSMSGATSVTGAAVAGYIQYFVKDPLVGQQNV